MNAGRPRKYKNRTVYTAVAEYELQNKFVEICRREGVSVSDKLSSFMEEYVKKHGSGNPQYTLLPFEDPSFRAVPALLGDKQTWVKHIHSSTIDEILEMERAKEFIGSVLKTAKHNKLREAMKNK